MLALTGVARQIVGCRRCWWRRWRRRRRRGRRRWRREADGRAGAARGRTRRRRIFRKAGARRRRGAGAGRAGGRCAERDQPQQRHAPPPEHGGQRAGSAPDAARGPDVTKIRAPRSRAPASSQSHPAICAASKRYEETRVRARVHTATGTPLPNVHDSARTLFRERRFAPPSPPALRALPILREIAGGR